MDTRDHIENYDKQAVPLKNEDGRTPGGARRPDLNPTGFVQPNTVTPEDIARSNRIAQGGAVQPQAPGAHDGLRKDSATGHLIGIEQAPFASHPDVGADYPRWVTPHASHVVMHSNSGNARTETGDIETEERISSIGKNNDNKSDGLKSEGDSLFVPRGSVVSVPGFEHHVRRQDGAIQVLVRNEEEEKRVMGESSDDQQETEEQDPTERLIAEQSYENERRAQEDEARDKRVAEIIKERRQQEIERAEKELEDKRQSIDDLKSDRRTAGSEGPRGSFERSRSLQDYPHQAQSQLGGEFTKSQEQLERDRQAVGPEKSTADTHDRSGPQMGGRSEADQKIGTEDWTTRSGPVQARPDKPFGNQGQK